MNERNPENFRERRLKRNQKRGALLFKLALVSVLLGIEIC